VTTLETQTSGLSTAGAQRLQVPHVVAGRLVVGNDLEYGSGDGSFCTPALDLDALVLPRSEPGPAFDIPLSDIISFLVETGKQLNLDKNAHLQEALDGLSPGHSVSRRVLEAVYRQVPTFFQRDLLEFQVENQIGRAFIDGWAPFEAPGRSPCLVRAFPPRVAHIMAGNSPVVAAMTIVRGALSKGIHLLKPAANDLLTAQAILMTMMDIDPDHPTVRSFSVAYWRGGDSAIEGALFRPQYFDKLVAWGSEASIRNAVSYAGPGFEVITFDPKVSISLIGSEAFASDETLRTAAAGAASDVVLMNQDGCACSRFHFVEGSRAEADQYAEILLNELSIDRPAGDGQARPTPFDLREEIGSLRLLEPDFRVWGEFDGRGVIVRSDEPVDFAPAGKTVNVVPVDRLLDAVAFTTVATQTVGVYPSERKAELRDPLATAGVQRLVSLGGSGGGTEAGLPHDGHFPFQQMMRWVYVD
jgi:hypothetical protein